MTTTGLGCDSSSTITSTHVRLVLGIRSPSSPPRIVTLVANPHLGVEVSFDGSHRRATPLRQLRFHPRVCRAVHENGSLHPYELECHCGTSGSTLFTECLSTTWVAACLRISYLTGANNSSPDYTAPRRTLRYQRELIYGISSPIRQSDGTD